MRSLIYTLRTVNDKSILSIDLTGLVISEDYQKIQLNLPSGVTTLNKWDYLNKEVIYDDGKVFFMICNKAPDRKWVTKVLLEYALTKIDTRIDNLHTLKSRYQKELAA